MKLMTGLNWIDLEWHIAVPNLMITALIVWWAKWWVEGMLKREREQALIASKEALPPAIIGYLMNTQLIKDIHQRLERLESHRNYVDTWLEQQHRPVTDDATFPEPQE